MFGQSQVTIAALALLSFGLLDTTLTTFSIIVLRTSDPQKQKTVRTSVPIIILSRIREEQTRKFFPKAKGVNGLDRKN